MAVTSWLKAFAPSQVRYGKGPTAKLKIMAFGHCNLFEKILQPFSHIDAVSHCTDNGFIFDKTYLSLVSMHTEMIFPNQCNAHCPESRIFAILDLFSLLEAFE